MRRSGRGAAILLAANTLSFAALSPAMADGGVDAPARNGTVQELETDMQITVIAQQATLVYDLNESTAAKELYAQLPMDIEVENYGGIENIFYPPRKLETADTPLARNVQAGTLAYYAPWGDVVMFYDSFRPAPGLYELGQIVSGREDIEVLSGTIRIEKSGGQ